MSVWKINHCVVLPGKVLFKITDVNTFVLKDGWHVALAFQVWNPLTSLETLYGVYAMLCQGCDQGCDHCDQPDIRYWS